MTASAAFSLVDFKITEFTFKRLSEQRDVAIGLHFVPSGVYKPQDGTFRINLLFSCVVDEQGIEIIKGNLVGNFQFSSPFPDSSNNIPPFFYVNSIAILFPYVRAFISTITLQSNSGLIVLPTLNLTNLEGTLRQSTIDSLE